MDNSHNGQLVEYAVRKRGISLTDLSIELGVNRRTIYNWFDTPFLKKNIIYRIGVAVNHDFSVEFPQYFASEMFSSDKIRTAQNNGIVSINQPDWKDKYIDLLEKYNQILASMHTRV
ncbi:hypothetical protein IM792_09180 [Mucilaginibacter sp. JRF]|uniref:hypothetical protein n=1 Tax=Mucilaginibacter sp. JRF TaxID=2780088 RepID=UPI00187EC5C5|nr:hypothetical protein [Mucilaginibacter sp. JRF]MBE9584616.1 hypothetical protein [Mucilaginibacter sp. JRF]